MRVEEKQGLEERLEFETMPSDLSARFVNIPSEELDGEIRDAERRFCEFLDLDLAALWPDTEEMPWAFVTSNLATASVSQAKIFLANAFGWNDAMLYVPCEMGNLQVESR
jgi:hypothetical protein